MLVLVAIGLVAGVVTSLSPCVLPVLPVVLTAGSTRPTPTGPAAGTVLTDRRVRSWRPYAVVGGLVLSFSASTLLGSLVLSALGLPQDLLRNAGIVMLVVIGLGMVFPPVGELLERPFVRLTGRPVDATGNGLVVGLGAGLLFVPCAGPVLAAIAVLGATHRIGVDAVVLTVAFGVGVGIPLLLVALAGDALVRRTAFLRAHARRLRVAGGVIMIVIAVAVALNLTDGLQRLLPGYTAALQGSVESSDGLRQLTAPAPVVPGSSEPCQEDGPTLEDCGAAPALTGITGWLNTPGNQALDAAALRGRVVLIDFWTYSCINCQRTLPHLEALYRTYGQAGLVIIGVHTPEFAFEHVTANIASQSAALGVRYPVAIDNDYATWDAFQNQYWPAEYLIDPAGTVRHVKFGEGDYDGTERLVRQLLGAAHPEQVLPPPTDVVDPVEPASALTPETYLGYDHQQSTSGIAAAQDSTRVYPAPTSVAPDTVALTGSWTSGPESVTAGSAGSRLQLNYQASKVYLVLGGTGTVQAEVNGVTTTVPVSGPPTLHTVVDGTSDARALLTLTMSSGVQAYAFTFG